MPVRDLYEVKELFRNVASGDERAFRSIFDLYRKKVYAVALKMLKSETDAEEIVQEVFLSVWVIKSRMDEIHDPEGYLFTITYNTIYTHLKKASRNGRLLDAIIKRVAVTQNTTEETITVRETEKLLREAILLLPPQQKIIYNLSKQEGLSYDEIAERLQISRNTVRNHLAEAMKTIRSFLKKATMLLMSLMIFILK